MSRVLAVAYVAVAISAIMAWAGARAAARGAVGFEFNLGGVGLGFISVLAAGYALHRRRAISPLEARWYGRLSLLAFLAIALGVTVMVVNLKNAKASRANLDTMIRQIELKSAHSR